MESGSIAEWVIVVLTGLGMLCGLIAAVAAGFHWAVKKVDGIATRTSDNVAGTIGNELYTFRMDTSKELKYLGTAVEKLERTVQSIGENISKHEVRLSVLESKHE